MKIRLLFLIIFIFLFSACSSDDKSNSGQISPAAQQEKFLNQYSSPNQIAFHRALKNFSKEYKDSSNEIKKSAVFRKRRDYLLKTIQGGRVLNWVGFIKKIGTTKGGEFAYVNITSEIAEYPVSYRTRNNRLSDIGDNTMIPLNTYVYNQLANLNEGEKVIFSARFLADKQDGYKEGGLTEQGNVTESDFIVKFIDIRKFKDALASPIKQTDVNTTQNNEKRQYTNNTDQTKLVIEDNTLTSGTSETGKYFKVIVKQVQNGKVIKSNEWSFSKWKDDGWRYRTDEMKGNTSIVYNSEIFEYCMKKLGWTYVKNNGYYN